MKKIVLSLALLFIFNSKSFSQTIQVQGYITDYTVVTLNLVGNDAGSPARNIYEGTYFGISETRPIRISWSSDRWYISIIWSSGASYIPCIVTFFASYPNPPNAVIGDWVDQCGAGLLNPTGDRTQSTLLSINEINSIDETVKLFPNPTSSLLNINTTSTILSTQITDTNGRVIQVLSHNSNEAILDIENFQTGMYFLKVSTENGSSTQKIIKK